MYVETGIPLRIPYRKTFTVDGANHDMQWWNRYCDVNWSAYKFASTMNGRVDPSSIIVSRFYVDIDVYQAGEKCNVESAPRLEEFLARHDVARLWVATQHGFNCYIKAPPGCGQGHVEELYHFLANKGIDVDPCMVNPLAQRKAINSLMHEPMRFVIPLRPEEVLHEDIDDIVKKATRPRVPVSGYWTGSQPFKVAGISTRKHEEIKEALLPEFDGMLVNTGMICPTIAFIARKDKIGFFERLDFLRYLRAVLCVPKSLLGDVAARIVGEKKWKNMSGWEHVLMMASRGGRWFSPGRFKLDGYCPRDCFWCIKRQQDLSDLMYRMKSS